MHEQSRPDRDDYVKVHFKNIQKYSKLDADKWLEMQSPYDWWSIMQYSRKAYGGLKTTISYNIGDKKDSVLEPRNLLTPVYCGFYEC